MKPSETGNKAYNRKKWSILFIGEDGKVVTVKHFKGMVSVLAVVLIALMVAVAVLYFQYRSRTERAKTLREDMVDVVTENRSLKDEKEQMLARLVILESELKVREERQSPEEMGRAQDRGAASNATGKEPAPLAPNPKKEPEKPQKSADSASAGSAQAIPPPISIANENLIVCQDSETEFMRYLRKTASKDITLARSMIPLGSCTMKLNAASQLMPVSWPEFASLHPFVPEWQAEGYIELIENLVQLKNQVKLIC